PYHFSFFLFMPRPPPQSTLFPYTTLFRSSARSTLKRATTIRSPHRSRGCCLPSAPGHTTSRVASSTTAARAPAGIHRAPPITCRSEEHTSELQSRFDLVCRLLLEKKKLTV